MEKSIIELLNTYEVIQSGHFLMPSGKHSDRYIQCAKLLQYPDKAGELLKLVAKSIKASKLNFDLVLGPAVGGVLVAYELARQLEKPFIYAERYNGLMKLPKWTRIEKGQRILIAEDVITSGKTVRETKDLVERLGAKVVGVACIVNKEGLPVKPYLYSGITLRLESCESEACLLCKDQVPLQSGK